VNEDVRPFEEYKEMIKDMRKEEMIKGLYDLSARVIKQENIIKEVREYIEEKYDYILKDDTFLDHDERIDKKQIQHILEILDKGE
jgi:hypothetical protein